jgi:hypothetical protein
VFAAALTGCFVEAEAEHVCQRSEVLAIDAVGDGRGRPLSVQQHVDFAVPVRLGDRLVPDVTLETLVLRETSGAGSMDFVSRADVEVAPPAHRQGAGGDGHAGAARRRHLRLPGRARRHAAACG